MGDVDPLPHAALRTVRGYACTFGNVDGGRDRVVRGAFARSLRERPAAEVRMLFQHDAARPLGRWTRIVEDGHGLWVEGVLAPAPSAQDVAGLLAGGALDGLSIGYRTRLARRDPRTGVRVVERVDLHEVSLVTFPMNARARLVRRQPQQENRP